MAASSEFGGYLPLNISAVNAVFLIFCLAGLLAR
jgi:hypothetical protein